MRSKPLPVIEKGRKDTNEPGDPCGMFLATCPTTGARLTVVSDDGSAWKEANLPGEPWEHVSVSTPTRCPSWEEMCWVKDVFFSGEETVVQLHPPKSKYVNDNPYVPIFRFLP
jgi:hypothetical protein